MSADDEILGDMSRLVRVALTASGQLSDAMARARERRSREAMQQLDERRRAATAAGDQEKKDWVASRRAVYGQADRVEWRERATLVEMADAYHAAREARDSGIDPAANRVTTMLHAEGLKTYGVNFADAYDQFRTAEQQRRRAAEEEAQAAQVRETAAERDRDLNHQEKKRAEGYRAQAEEEVRATRNLFGGVGGQGWMDAHSAEDWAQAYHAARLLEDQDRLAQLAATRLEQELARAYPDTYPDPAAVRSRWDTAYANAERGTHAPDPHAERQVQIEDNAAHQAETAEHLAEQDRSREGHDAARATRQVQHMDRRVSRRQTTRPDGASGPEVQEAEVIAREAAPGFVHTSQRDTGKRRATGGRPKARGLNQQGKIQKRNR